MEKDQKAQGQKMDMVVEKVVVDLNQQDQKQEVKKVLVSSEFKLKLN